MSSVQRLVFGAASLGSRYGLPRPGEDGPLDRRPRLNDGLIARAFAGGITKFDTAPAYGESESRLGDALEGKGDLWTKVRGEPSSPSFEEDALASIEQSLQHTKRGALAVVQWHNWTPALLDEPAFRALWERLAKDPRVRALGASTYGPEDAAAAVESGLFSVVQVEWNILNRRVVRAVGERALARGVALAVRSVLLQGVLTDEGRELPGVAKLSDAVVHARALAQAHGRSLTEVAIRGALDESLARYVIIGFDSPSQVDAAITAARSPSLSPELSAALAALDLGGDAAVDPRTWGRLAAPSE